MSRPGRRVPGRAYSKCKGPGAEKDLTPNTFKKLKAYSMATGRKRQTGSKVRDISTERHRPGIWVFF